MSLHLPWYQCTACSCTRRNRSAAIPEPVFFSHTTSCAKRQPAKSLCCVKNIRIDPKHHSELVYSATRVGQPVGHRSHTSEVSPYGGSAMQASAVMSSCGSNSSIFPW